MKFEDLVGHHIVDIKGLQKDSEEVSIITKTHIFKLYHEQDCCESVWLEDIEGDRNDLIDGIVISAGEATSEDGYVPYESEASGKYFKTLALIGALPEFTNPPQQGESNTWTFYHIQTSKGHVMMRWNGSSNGYYSESVYVEITKR